MSSYHINQKTNRPNICRASQRNCPVGGQHFSDRTEALAFIEAENAKNFSTFTKPLNKKWSVNRVVDSYVKSKGISTQKKGVEAIFEQFNEEYGYILDSLKNKSKVELSSSIDLDKVHYHPRYYDSIEGREPKGEFPIVSILVEHNGYYKIIDGYHRFKWAKENNYSGNFLILK